MPHFELGHLSSHVLVAFLHHFDSRDFYAVFLKTSLGDVEGGSAVVSRAADDAGFLGLQDLGDVSHLLHDLNAVVRPETEEVVVLDLVIAERDRRCADKHRLAGLLGKRVNSNHRGAHVWPEDRHGIVVVQTAADHCRRSACVGLIIVHDELKLRPADTAAGIDLIDSELRTFLDIVAENGAATRKRSTQNDLDGL
jgi:hypothetical protein